MTSLHTTIPAPTTWCGLRSGSRTAVVGWATGLFVLVLAVSLSRSLFDPFSQDHGVYQYITERVMAGERMYVDVWDQNAPGIILIHWLATLLTGGTPLGLRLFDAGWQCLTLAALVLLGARDGGRWQTGWLAAALYVLAYYSAGYVHTAQREGFVVLPLMIAVHALLPPHARTRERPIRPALAASSLAGAMCLFVFAVKPPLGMCFGVLWLYALSEGWRSRHLDGWRSLTHVLGLTIGFCAAMAVAIAMLLHLGWWSGLLTTLTRDDVPGYIRGPGLIRLILPYLAVGVPLALLAAGGIALGHRPRGPVSTTRRPSVITERCAVRQGLHAGTVLLVVFGLLLTLQRWDGWQQCMIRLVGLFLPAVGFVCVRSWARLTVVQRYALLLAAASLTAVALQGWFFLYHLFPVLAFASYLASCEIVDRLRRLERSSPGARVWTMACLGGILHLAVSTWGWTMTFYTASPYVLHDTTLAEHYTRITRHRPTYPTYATTAAAARRVRELTGPDDPIACLINEPRLYYLSQRPAAHPMIIPSPAFAPMFEDFIRTLHETRPPVLLARVPRPARDQAPADQITVAGETEAINEAVFREAEAHFGPSVRLLIEHYHVTDVIDDVCILQPR